MLVVHWGVQHGCFGGGVGWVGLGVGEKDANVNNPRGESRKPISQAISNYTNPVAPWDGLGHDVNPGPLNRQRK